MTPEPKAVTTRLKSRPIRKAVRALPREQFSQEAKSTFCLIVFLCALVLTIGLVSWMRAPLQDAAAPLPLQLYPMEYCLTDGLNADTKSAQLENLRFDSWYVIPAYASSLLFLGLSVFCASGVEWRWGLAIILLTVFTVQCDFLENHHLEQCLDGNQAAAFTAYAWTRWKWAMFSFAVAALAPRYVQRKNWRRLLGASLLVSGATGLLALIPTEKIAPMIRYVLIPLLMTNLLLIGIVSAVDLLQPKTQAPQAKTPRQRRRKNKIITGALQESGEAPQESR